MPEDIKRQAREAFALFERDPYHPSLHFKRVHPARPIYSARVSLDYRAVGVVDAGEITWLWIASHAEYEHLLKQMR
ncbi:MAG: hypothetical protein M5U09_02705 [Gammaproteobacteria bacterium]|nr:hypothetical protein [Gammaproteobacteria bacterium]